MLGNFFSSVLNIGSIRMLTHCHTAASEMSGTVQRTVHCLENILSLFWHVKRCQGYAVIFLCPKNAFYLFFATDKKLRYCL